VKGYCVTGSRVITRTYAATNHQRARPACLSIGQFVKN